ncbi:Cationic trypsin-like 2 [Homarus americanus]|uniref:Cationic trypsin-like 2 n=1 Tax=Homarus americanus TaxID=6706 RepID=A0A8J5K2R5_HOMAM|nr:Cationic trypsin-like 2 [Homarus americanus]
MEGVAPLVGTTCGRSKLVGSVEASNTIHHDLADLSGGLYNDWTNWSRCSMRCKQRRRRSCRAQAVCGTAVLKEERSCTGGRCSGRRPFHIIRPEEFSRQPPRNDMRVLLNFNSMFYTRWSRWSSCSRSCLTRRYRSCKYPLFCGGSVVHEEAYCYIEGSLCEKWYRRNRQNSRKHKPGDRHDAEDNETTPSVSTSSSPSFGSSPSSHHHSTTATSSSTSISSERTLPRECGVSNVTTPGWSLRIIGGRTAQPGEWPWQVVILNRYHEAFCGGTLVASKWVLTAAHCVRRKLYVRLGEHDLAIREGPEIEYKVARTVTHPQYDSTTVDNDVALLQLPEAVESGPRVAPACLPQQGASLPVGDTCTIIGWGKEKNTHIFGTDVLHEAEVPIIASKVCESVYQDYYITSNMFCAGYRKGRVDSCAGDSGGPLLCHRYGRWYIHGITSFGEGCGKRGKFGIYARVSNYRNWIQSVIASPYP